MSSEKRLLLFLVLTFCSIFAMQYVMDLMGLTPPPPKKPAPVAQAKPEPGKSGAAAQDKEKEPAEVVAKDGGKEEGKTEPAPPAVASAKKAAIPVIDPGELVLGSAADKSPKGYRLEIRLEQNGAGVSSVASSRFEAEFVEGMRRHRPLQLIRHDPKAPPSLALSLVLPGADPQAASEGSLQGEHPLDQMLWEVVRDDQGRIVRPIPADAKPGAEDGQEIVFRATVGEPEVTLAKRYRLMKDADAFELEITFESPEKERSLVYKLLGPHGIPIEGEWYTGTFRDVFFGQVEGRKVTIVTKSGYDIAKGKDNPERFQSLPLKFAGVENQYFASFVEPDPTPPTTEARWDSEAIGVVIHGEPQALQKADVTVQITSKPVKVGPNVPVTHKYKVFAGPKTADALQPYGAEALASYRKNQWFGIPFAPEVASVIAPLLDHIYDLTRRVTGVFGGTRGNYGVAIILLTLLVRLIMFPLGRKQALAAKKMQDLQPLLKGLQEKYKDDKERQTKEVWALYRKHGVNPLGGCLPALIQLPIFVGLWQALNNSVHLRHASFLYIKDLAAPDMLARFPMEVPILGRYFNLLPFLVVALMLIQTKLFSPPPTTPEAEMQQKMMKYMMIFMAFMFYKVPSGLGIYFITSSLWQIGERLLLPKVTHVAPAAGDEGTPPPGGGGRGGPGGGGGNGDEAPPKPPGRIARLWEKVMEEAAKDPTYRKLVNDGGKGKGEEKERDRGRDRDRGKPKARPGRRR
ncbi:MAG TPA: membrane protein insertase YidC [Isosphaeraceae bacterium]|nr:membrane protein insertase YidC [Isosphaeraceae bacterium]